MMVRLIRLRFELKTRMELKFPKLLYSAQEKLISVNKNHLFTYLDTNMSHLKVHWDSRNQ